MKHFSPRKFLMAIGALLGLGLSAQAQQVPAGYFEMANYLENFSTASSSSLPLGWTRQKDASFPGNISYGTTASGKVGTAYGATTNQVDKSYSSTVYQVYDYIVTPAVKGTMDFSFCRYSTNSTYMNYPPLIEVYKMTKQSDGSFTCDPTSDLLLTIEEAEFTDEKVWKDKSYEIGNDYQFLGFRLSYAYIDEVSFSYAQVPINKKLTIVKTTFNGGSNTVNANPDGTVDLVVDIQVRNDGNYILDPDVEENYTISFGPYASGKFTEIFGTVSYPLLEPGETKTFQLSHTYQIPEDATPNSSGEVSMSLYRQDNYNNTSPTNISYVYMKVYKPLINLSYYRFTANSGSTTLETIKDAYVDFGVSNEPISRKFRINNSGAGPLTVTGFVVSEGTGVTLAGMTNDAGEIDDIAFPWIIPAGGAREFLVVMDGNSGLNTANLKFESDGMVVRDNVNLRWDKVAANEFFSNFEGENPLEGWYLPGEANDWKVDAYTDTERNANRDYVNTEYTQNSKRLANEMRNVADFVISPLLSFEDNGKFVFYAAKKANNEAETTLRVKYSVDRANWTDLPEILITNENKDYEFSSGTSSTPTSGGANILKRFEYTMPAGEYYVALEGQYIFVDNFHGGTLVPVDFDIASVSASAGKKRMVNNELDFTASFKNINTEGVAEEGQTVTLYANGEAVANAEAQAIAPGATVTYDFSYIPHVDGATALYAEIKIGEYKVTSPIVNVNVLEEMALKDNQIGTPTTTGSNIPIRMGDNNAKSEFVYTAEDLAGVSGKITKLTYPYYKNTDDRSVDQLRIWLQNTDAEDVGGSDDLFTDVETMVKVLDTDDYTFVKAGSSTDLQEMEFTFDTPFDYTGGNLRVVVEALTPKYGSINWGIDESNGKNRKGRYTSNDNRITYTTNSTGKGSYVQQGLPVVIITTAKELNPVEGEVYSDDNNPIEGALVRAYAKDNADIYYETTTDQSGKWQLIIYRDDLEFLVSASAEGYEASTPVALDMTGSNDIVLYPGEAVPAPVESAYPSATKKDNGKYDIVLVWDHPTAAAKGLKRYSTSDSGYTYEVHLDQVKHGETAENTYTINDVEAGDHVAEVYTKSATGKLSEALSIPFNADIATAVANVNVENGEVRYFNLNGIEVKGDRLEPGIYVRVQGTKSDKVRINK